MHPRGMAKPSRTSKQGSRTSRQDQQDQTAGRVLWLRVKGSVA